MEWETLTVLAGVQLFRYRQKSSTHLEREVLRGYLVLLGIICCLGC